MCKLAYTKTKEDNAYEQCKEMILSQEHLFAGHSTGFALKKENEFTIKKAIGRMKEYLEKHPQTYNTKECLGHSRYATIGSINLNNQHPIPILIDGKIIAYAAHNGTFNEYTKYTYLRNGIKNKTDSALLFTMYGKLLEQLGNNASNRRKAFEYIMSLIRHEENNNIIIMFKDGTTLFSGNALTYTTTPNVIKIMTLNLPKTCNNTTVYEINGMDVKTYPMKKTKI